MKGTLDGVFFDEVHGWASDPSRPSELVQVDVVVNGARWQHIRAGLERSDLEAAGIGARAFRLPLAAFGIPPSDVRQVNAYVAGLELEGSPWRPASATHLPNYHVDPMNIRRSLAHLKGKAVEFLAVDINDLCNAECVYCPHHRTSGKVELADFEALLNESVSAVEFLQLGCAQEPAADKRLGDFFRALPKLRCRPGRIQLISNGTLLDRHDPAAFREGGLKALSLSLDTADPELNRKLRRGTDLARIVRNVSRFLKECPGVELWISAVVSAPTVDGIPELIELCDGLGATQYFFREVTDGLRPGSPARRADYFEWIEALKLPPGRLKRLQEDLAESKVAGRYTVQPTGSINSLISEFKSEERRASSH
jgi:molybdenum cofactor biosynthesis enzyme MoaA